MHPHPDVLVAVVVVTVYRLKSNPQDLPIEKPAVQVPPPDAYWKDTIGKFKVHVVKGPSS